MKRYRASAIVARRSVPLYLGPERRKRVEARAAGLIAEEKSLRDLRQARRLTQQRMAK
jgi:hypothetical protein